jgi:hypothetical protein
MARRHGPVSRVLFTLPVSPTHSGVFAIRPRADVSDRGELGTILQSYTDPRRCKIVKTGEFLFGASALAFPSYTLTRLTHFVRFRAGVQISARIVALSVQPISSVRRATTATAPVRDHRTIVTSNAQSNFAGAACGHAVHEFGASIAPSPIGRSFVDAVRINNPCRGAARGRVEAHKG